VTVDEQSHFYLCRIPYSACVGILVSIFEIVNIVGVVLVVELEDDTTEEELVVEELEDAVLQVQKRVGWSLVYTY
jgi:hypothetical protein